MLTFFINSKTNELVISVSIFSTVWEDTDGCANQFMCDLVIYLMTVLSSLYGITMDRVINEPGHGKNVVDELNSTEKRHLK